jgi:hypothetical protein
MAKRNKTASVGLYNELIAQAKFAQDPDKIVFVLKVKIYYNK